MCFHPCSSPASSALGNESMLLTLLPLDSIYLHRHHPPPPFSLSSTPTLFHRPPPPPPPPPPHPLTRRAVCKVLAGNVKVTSGALFIDRELTSGPGSLCRRASVVGTRWSVLGSCQCHCHFSRRYTHGVFEMLSPSYFSRLYTQWWTAIGV